MTLNVRICKAAKWTHISQSKGPVAGRPLHDNKFSFRKMCTLCEMWVCHCNSADDSVSLGCDAVLSARCSHHSWTAIPWR